VLDLRGNPGGLLEAAVDVCEKFLKKGDRIVSVIGRDSTQKKDYYSSEEPIAGKLPMAVLVDNGSASASEIVAGAIQDHDRGIIVGETTFGKGLVQSVVPLTVNTSLKMTTARYYTPSGRCIQKVSYSEKNKVFEIQGANKVNQFYTDRKRKVFSAGGIAPDSVTESGTLSPITLKLLAEGMYFKFATNYFSSHPNLTSKSLNGEQIFNDFSAYLKTNNFVYISRAERGVEQLKKILKEGNYPQSTVNELEHLAGEMEKNRSLELTKNKKEITEELLDEINLRLLGRREMIKEAMKQDRTFGIVLNIFNNKKAYNKLLNISE
jgi:carboxyl-terminal processing protease